MNSTSLTLEKIKSVKNKKGNKKVSTDFWTKAINREMAMKISAVILILILIVAGSFKIAKATEGKILPKVTIAGIKVGGKTPTEAKKMVQSYVDTINEQGPKITYEDQLINPKLSEMGMSFNVDQAVNEAYNYGRSGNWKNRVNDNSKMIIKNHNIILAPIVDEQKFDAYLGQIAQVVEIAPENANLVINNGDISVSPSKIGRGLDKDSLEKDLTKLINENKLNSEIKLVTSDLQPNIKEAGTIEAQEQAQKLISAAPITITFEDQVYTADKAEVGSWINFSQDGNKLVADVSNSKINGFVAWIASKIEIDKIDREIMEGTNQVLVEGQDGRGVDSSGLVSALRARVLSATTGPAISVGTYLIAKNEIVKNPHAQPCRYSGRYIDINLSEQTLYAFEGCNLVNQFLVSTGLTGPTPTGEFSVYSKSRVARMTGPGYDLPGVEWVSWWSGDYSIHGTYWHHNFGHPMSHGCVNASNADAEWIYNWDDVGTPVYIHW